MHGDQSSDSAASPPQSDDDEPEPADPNPPEPYQDYLRRMAINDEDDDEGGDRRYNLRRNRPADYREVTSGEDGSADPEK